MESENPLRIRDEIRRFIRVQLGKDPDEVPDILILDDPLSNGELRSLYANCDAFVLPSRGEGFGRCYLEALCNGLPVIATRWGGHLDFLNDNNAYLIDIEGIEPVPDDVSYYRGCMWSRPSIEHLRVLMRYVFEHPEEGRLKAQRELGSLIGTFHVKRVGNLIVRELNRLFE